MEKQILITAATGNVSKELINLCVFNQRQVVAAVAYKTLLETGYLNQAYALTGREALDYFVVAAILSECLGKEVRYANPPLWRFVLRKFREGTALGFAIVMAGIYGTAKMGQAALITPTIAQILGREPIVFKKFAEDYRDSWL